MNIQQYINNVSALFNTGKSTEHSYRGDLQQLLSSILKDVVVTNEPKRIECGAPDYILTRKDIPIGYIEAKDVGVKLGDKIYKEQFDRYKSALNNLIITDYLEFHFYRNANLVSSISIAKIENGKVYAKPETFDQFTALIEDFALQVTQTIKSPTTLAQMMASKARLMANVIESALDEDDKKQKENQQNYTDLQSQMNAFKSVLIHDINNKSFSDIYAQTIAYGLFAARYHDSTLKTFSRQEAATLIPQSNPFLRKLFQYIAGYELDSRLTWLVDELVQIFLATDVASVMNNFGRSTRQHDPIIHFYETFLAEYDPKLRKSRGVWYTPEPVVSFIVSAVNDILKTHFNLPQGLADTSKTKVKIKTDKPDRRTASGYVELEKELHKVQILDPATGTGTFLAQTVRQIYDGQFKSMQGAWTGYVKEHLIPRLYGFELLMTSYAMAHLKLDMILNETGYKADVDNPKRLRIYLTNSLEEHHEDTGTLFANWLSTEANEANHIKRDAPVMVVMGNPPYSGISSNNGEWISNLINDYKYIDGEYFNERKHWLNDDYVKFIRYGQHFIDKNKEGVLAFINPHGFLNNPTFRGMRWNLLKTFDEIYILDLHGNAKRQETAPDGSKDENVFDIMQGVSINFFIKTGKKKNELGKVFHFDVYGKRTDKYRFLNEVSWANLGYKELECTAPNYFFMPKDFSNSDEYKAGFKVTELFGNNVTGIVTMGDGFIIADSKSELQNRLESLKKENMSEAALKAQFKLGKNYAAWVISNKARLSLNDDKYMQIAYRPFDTKWTYFDNKLIWRWRYETMKHMLSSENLGMSICRQLAGDDTWHHVLATNGLTDDCYVSNKTKERGYVFPLYIYSDIDMFGEVTRTPNLDTDIVNNIAIWLNLEFTIEKTNQLNTFAPVDLLDYIYAVLHCPTYRDTYAEFLKIDFPRVPYPNDAHQFWQLVALGNELRRLHLLEGTAVNELITTYPEGGSDTVDNLHYDNERVYINDTQYFEGVPELAWEFYIGGYQPAQKWLKDRKGMMLGYQDILHYQKIIKVMVETDRLMQEIDKMGVV